MYSIAANMHFMIWADSSSVNSSYASFFFWMRSVSVPSFISSMPRNIFPFISRIYTVVLTREATYVFEFYDVFVVDALQEFCLLSKEVYLIAFHELSFDHF
jgi:hypothetical protein